MSVAVTMDVAPAGRMLYKQTVSHLVSRLRNPAFSVLSIGLPVMFFALFNAIFSQAASGNPGDFNTFGPALTSLSLGVIVNFLVEPLLYGGVTFAVCQSALGRPVTLGGVLRGSLRR